MRIQKELVTCHKVKDTNHDEEYHVKWRGVVIGSVHRKNGLWAAITRFDTIVCNYAFKRKNALQKLIRAFKQDNKINGLQS